MIAKRAWRGLTESFQQRRWQWLGGLVVAAAVYGYIALLLWREWPTLDLSQFHLRYQLLGVSWLAHTAGALLAVWTWMALLRWMGHDIPLRRHIKVYATTNLARRLPGFVWWLVGRAYMYDRDGIAKRVTSAGAVLEMVLTTTAALFVATLITLLPGYGMVEVSPALLVGLLVVFVALLHPRLFEAACRRMHIAGIPRFSWRQLLLLFCSQVGVIIIGGVALYFLLGAIHPVSLETLPRAMQGWALTVVSGSALFWLPFDFGLAAGVLALVLNTFLAAPIALIVALAWRLWVGVCELIWGIFGLVLPAPRSPVTVLNQEQIVGHGSHSQPGRG